MKFQPHLLTINNFAKKHNVTTSYIYKLITLKRIEPIEIDGMKFIDINKYKDIKK